MRNHNVSWKSTLGLALLWASPTFAQDRQPVSAITGQPPLGESRFEVGLAFAQLLGTSSFSASQTFRVNQEDGTFNGSYEVGKAAGGGIDVQYNLKEKFGVRLGAQKFSRKSEGTFEATVPHPFFYARPRSTSGTAGSLSFSEAAFTLTGVYRGGSGKWKVNLEGGPAYFSVDATVAERVAYSEVYPYDTITFTGISSVKRKASPLGFAVGLEIGRDLSDAVSVIAQGRFTQGSGEIDVNGQKIDIKAGGGQVGIGLRIVLARKRPVS